MKSLVICGSRRFEPEIRALEKHLLDAGATIYSPYLHSGKQEWAELSDQYKRYVALGLTHDHFYKLRMADIVYVFNKDGYSGVSTTLEIGYAAALDKPIYAYSDQDPELCRLILFRGIITEPDKILNILR